MKRGPGGALAPDGFSPKRPRMEASIDYGDGTTPAASLPPPSMAGVTVPPAPVYTPTLEEWADPSAYLAKIAPEASQFGIAKIVPPLAWDLPCTIAARMASKVKYKTRAQALDTLQDGLPFPDGNEYTFRDYRAMANKFKETKYPQFRLGAAKPAPPPVKPRYGGASIAPTVPAPPTRLAATVDPSAGSPISMLAPLVEAEYWRIVERRSGAPSGLVVEYGNDQDTKEVGSGFPLPHGGIAGYLARGESCCEPLEAGISGDSSGKADPGGLAASATPAAGSSGGVAVAVASAGGAGAGAAHEAGKTRASVPPLPSKRGLPGALSDPSYYARTGWNLNLLPYARDSLLRFLGEEINGVTVPWLYLGMLFATFAWHNEDHYLYSVNYMHYGEGKVWYGVPGINAPDFERAMRGPSLAGEGAADKDIIYQLTKVLPPSALMAAHVPVYRLVQESGEFIITFPQAYHSGFSLGFNMAEACNFAMPDWVPYSIRAIERYRSAARPRSPVFSHEQLLCSLALAVVNGTCGALRSPASLATLEAELRSCIVGELEEREALERDGARTTLRLQHTNAPRYECHKCKHICYLSAVVCSCPASAAEKRVSCLRHYASLCGCSVASRMLVYWYGAEELSGLCEALAAARLAASTAARASSGAAAAVTSST